MRVIIGDDDKNTGVMMVRTENESRKRVNENKMTVYLCVKQGRVSSLSNLNK